MCKHYVESEDVQVCIVNAATSLDMDQVQIDYTGFTGPCLGGKSVMATQTEVNVVQDAEVQVDLGFTGLCLGDNGLIATQTKAKKLTVSQKGRVRQKWSLKRWEEEVKKLQYVAKA